jgi:predicted RNA-binding protein with PIN domain
MNGFKHILVDGWNAIHSHPKLARLLVENKAELAQTELSEMLASVHDYDGVRITIVYDGNGADISIVRKSKILTFSEVYTPSSMTADELIEQLCATSKAPQSLLVITRDNLLRLTASSFGVSAISPEKFFEWSNESHKSILQTAQSNNEKGSREWKKSNPFAVLDELAIDIKSATRKSPLVSKHLKKQMKKSGEIVTEPKETKQSLPTNKKEKMLSRRVVIGGRPASKKSLDELKSILEKGELPKKRAKKRNS